MQHSRVAIDNLVKLTTEHGTDILLLQEPYTIQNIAGIPKIHIIFAHAEDTSRAAIVVTTKSTLFL